MDGWNFTNSITAAYKPQTQIYYTVEDLDFIMTPDSGISLANPQMAPEPRGTSVRDTSVLPADVTCCIIEIPCLW